MQSKREKRSKQKLRLLSTLSIIHSTLDKSCMIIYAALDFYILL